MWPLIRGIYRILRALPLAYVVNDNNALAMGISGINRPNVGINDVEQSQTVVEHGTSFAVFAAIFFLDLGCEI